MTITPTETPSPAATSPETPLRQDLFHAARYYLRGWRGLVALAVLFAIPAFMIGGPWLVAAGLVPILVSLAPCLIMCALGLCMMKAANKNTAGSGAANAAPSDPSTPVVVPATTSAVTPAVADDSCCASKTPRS